MLKSEKYIGNRPRKEVSSLIKKLMSLLSVFSTIFPASSSIGHFLLSPNK